MDATHNKAVIGLSLASVGGFQFLDLAMSTFEPAFVSQAPGTSFGKISEDPLIDPIRNLLLSPGELGNYEIINVATTTSPAFFENGPLAGNSIPRARTARPGSFWRLRNFPDRPSCTSRM